MLQIDEPMPKCCSECFACDINKSYPFCTITFAGYPGMDFSIYTGRMKSCPLQEIPNKKETEVIKKGMNKHMFDYFEELRLEHKAELAQLKLRWEALKLQVEIEREKNPSLGNKLDAYLNMMKETVRDLILDQDDYDEEDLADYKYVFGEDYEQD